MKMNASICAFLNKLRNQIDGTGQSSAEVGEFSGRQRQQSSSQGYTGLIENPTVIYYSSKGDRPSIVFNSHRYHKETASYDVMPPEIYWRCSEKNCLGMVVTTANLGNFRMDKNHNHEPSTKALSSLLEDNVPVRIIATSLVNHSSQPVSTMVSPGILNTDDVVNTPGSPEKLPSQVSVVPRTNLTGIASQINADLQINEDNPSGSSTATVVPSVQLISKPSLPITVVVSTSSTVNPTVNVQTSKGICSTPLAAITPVVTAASCIATHKLATNKRKARLPAPATKVRVYNNSNNYAAATSKPSQIVKELVEFYRCPFTEGVSLIYKQHTYALKTTSNHITWMCKKSNCKGQIRSGWQFEYLSLYVQHNHEPLPEHERIVDVDRYISVDDALKALNELYPVKTKPPNATKGSDKFVHKPANEAGKKSLQRRYSTRC